jgi:hypothetical protein
MTEHTGVSGVDVLGLVLRLLLLTSTAVVGGTALLRPVVRSTGTRTAPVTWTASGLASVTLVLSLFLQVVSVPFAVTHLLLVLVLPGFLRSHTVSSYLGFALTVLLLVETSSGKHDPGFVTDAVLTAVSVVWLGLAVLSFTVPESERRSGVLRPRAVAIAASAGLAVAGLAQLLVSDVVSDRRLFTSTLGQVLLLVAFASMAVLVITVLWLRRGLSWKVYPVGAIAVVVTLVSSGSLQAVTLPLELPKPGVPLVAEASLSGSSVPVLVTPQRPGRNLVHFPENVGDGIKAGGSSSPVRATPRPGTNGSWVEVDLPPGRSDLVVERQGQQDTVEVDTGEAGSVPGSTGKDGPECASAALGAALAGSRDEWTRCPSESLPPTDAEALTKLVGFISRQGAPGLTLVADDSPRSRQAADAVVTSAARLHLPVHTSTQQGDALLVVSGWENAQQHLDEVRKQQGRAPELTYGVYLAPWLLHGPIANSVATSSFPLRFDPRDSRSLQYGMTLDASFGGDAPSVAGLRSWLGARGQQITDPVAVYAAAQVDVMKMDMPGMSDMSMHGSPAVGQWNPHGTVVAISPPLTN